MISSFAALSFALVVASATGQVDIPVEPATVPIEYMDGDATLLGHLAMPNATEKVPAVVIIPDWDGVNEYEQVRATLIAQGWGFAGFAADIYGADLQFVENVTQRGELATFYRSNPDVFGSRIRAAVEYVKSMPEVDSEKVSLIGYCFGGTGVLQYAMFGNDDVESIVSIHGGLNFLPDEPLPVMPKLLVLSGGDDDASTDIMDLEMTLDNATALWEITRYSNIQHAFSVFEDERYNPWADMRSWDSAYDFILESFELLEYTSVIPIEPNTLEVDYVDPMDGMELRGHLALPSAEWQRPLPAVVILPNWDGANEAERERATAFADMGYVAMVADIFGADKQYVETFEERGALITQYFENPELYVSRMTSAIDQLKTLTGDVDVNEMAMVGYCFGGSGAVLYSFFSGADMKVAVALHGSFTDLPPVLVDQISPYLLILSGGADVLHGNQTMMEEAFNSGNADWEITRYAGVQHGFTELGDAYNVVADARSWESTMTAFHELMAIPQKVGGTDDMTPGGAPAGDDEEQPEENAAVTGCWTFTMGLTMAALTGAFMAL